MAYKQSPHEIEIKYLNWMGLEPWHSGIKSPESCQFATKVINWNRNLEYDILLGVTMIKASLYDNEFFYNSPNSIPFNDLSSKLARFWTQNPDCQGSSPIQVRYLYFFLFSRTNNNDTWKNVESLILLVLSKNI